MRRIFANSPIRIMYVNEDQFKDSMMKEIWKAVNFLITPTMLVILMFLVPVIGLLFN